MMGKILIEADTERQTLKLEASKCTNVDFCATVTSMVKNAARNKMITDMDVVLMAKAFMDYIAPECALKVMDEEKPQRPKSKDFANLDDAMGMFDKLLRDAFGKGEGE